MTNPASAVEPPLARPIFQSLWIATIVCNVGTWMHDVGAAYSAPAFQAIVTQLVDRRVLQQAVALNSPGARGTLSRAGN